MPIKVKVKCTHSNIFCLFMLVCARIKLKNPHNHNYKQHVHCFPDDRQFCAGDAANFLRQLLVFYRSICYDGFKLFGF